MKMINWNYLKNENFESKVDYLNQRKKIKNNFSLLLGRKIKRNMHFYENTLQIQNGKRN